MVCDVDDRLLDFIAHKFHLVLRGQNGGRLALLAGSVPDAHLDRAGVSLLAMGAKVLEQQRIVTVALDSMGAVEDALTPARRPTVQGIGSVVLDQLDLLAVQVFDDAVLDTVGDTANGCAVVWGVVLDILLLRGETEHNVLAADAEFLDDGAQRQEGELGLFGSRHGGDVMYRTVELVTKRELILLLRGG